MKKEIFTSGKRKKAVARATLRPGKGLVKINSIPLQLYQPRIEQLKIQEPLILSGDVAQKVDILINVSGGGISAQAEAVRLAIGRALVEFAGKDTLRKVFNDYDWSLLTADTRQNEPHKPNDSKPRAKRQSSKR